MGTRTAMEPPGTGCASAGERYSSSAARRKQFVDRFGPLVEPRVIFLENTVETLMVEARAPFVLFGRSEWCDSWERTIR
jgi:hypothetical protein